jgi:hypothetical protein
MMAALISAADYSWTSATAALNLDSILRGSYRRLRVLEPPRIDPSAPRRIARPTPEPIARAALSAAESISPAWCPPRGPVVPNRIADRLSVMVGPAGAVGPVGNVGAGGIGAPAVVGGGAAGSFDAVRAVSFS